MLFHLSGTMTVAASALEAVRTALPEHIRLTREEPGCRVFMVEERGEGVFYVREEFASEADFHLHQQRIKGTEWSRVTADAVRDYRTWRTDG